MERERVAEVAVVTDSVDK